MEGFLVPWRELWAGDLEMPQKFPAVFLGAGKLRTCGVHGDTNDENTAWSKTCVNCRGVALIRIPFALSHWTLENL